MLDPLASRQLARLRESTSAYALQGLMLAFAGLMIIVGETLDPRPWLLPQVTFETWWIALIASGTLMGIGGWSLLRYPVFGRRMGLAGLSLFALVAAPGLVAEPGRALLTLLALLMVGFRIRRRVQGAVEGPIPIGPEITMHPRLFAGAVESTSLIALVAWFLVAGTTFATSSAAVVAAFEVFGVALVYTGVWVHRSVLRTRGTRRLGYLVLLVPLAGAAASYETPLVVLGWLALEQLLALGLLQAHRRTGSALVAGVVEHPARLLVFTFFAVCVFGGVALSLPIASAAGQVVQPIDAFFTAVSATCVTGLIVLDTPNAYSTVGHVVILVLFQVGGLGIMTFSTAGVLLLGQRIGLRHEAAVGGLLAGESGGELARVLRRILIVTFGTEAVGAAALSVLFFYEGDVPAMAVWRGVFTAVSAFCNSGFALQTDSLIPYQHNALILHVVAAIVIMGGLGPATVFAVPEILRSRPASMQAKLILVMSVGLLVICAALFALVEWNNTLAGLSTFEKVNNAWFDSAVTRTAGFNSVDYTRVHPATETITMAMMFIGGAPLSTAGGVKVTTIAIILLAVVAAIRGRQDVVAFGRRISYESIHRSIAIMTVGTFALLLAFIAIQLTQQMPFSMGLFEVVSALGTTGLSVGGTARLDGVGKIIIMVCMFVGRVGPITLFLLLAERRGGGKWGYPEERVAVG